MSKAYIAGPMTGYPAYNAEAFWVAAKDWADAGWRVVTPFECNSTVWMRHYGRAFDPFTDKCDWGDPILKEMFAEDVRALCSSDVVAFLPGWEKSRGATMEHRLATMFDLPCYDAGTFAPLSQAQAAESICAEADRLVSGDRQADYGHPIEDFTRTGRMWGAILGGPDVSPDKVALMMVALKISRECHKPKRDNRVDGCGYFKTLDMVRDKQAQ